MLHVQARIQQERHRTDRKKRPKVLFLPHMRQAASQKREQKRHLAARTQRISRQKRKACSTFDFIIGINSRVG